MLPVSIAAFGLLLCLMTRARLPRFAALIICVGIFDGLVLYAVIALSRHLGAEEFDESVIFHVFSGIRGVPKSILVPIIAVTVFGLVAAAALSVWLYFRSSRSTAPKRLLLPISALSAIAFCTNPVTLDMATSGYFYLTENAARPAEYQTPLPTRFTRKPNIVYIYLESLEHTFLNGAIFPGLAPNLKKIESEAISFTNIQQTYGTGWTLAGMVASQCGIPLSTDVWNSMAGLDSFLPGATCLGDLLAAQGYALDYVGGADIAFAGKGSFYKTHRFDQVQGQTELASLLRDPTYQNVWGLYDDTLFDIFKQRFDERVASGRPFGLFTLTNSTHPPDGNVPRTCSARYGDGSDGILDAVQCTDLYVAAVVDHIRHSSAGDNTIIVIGSDHLAMRSPTTERWLEGQQRRDLLLMLVPGAAPVRIDKPGTTLDVAPTLLGLFSDIHNLGFGTDLRGNANTLLQSKLDSRLFLKSKVPFLNTLWDFPALDAATTIDPVQAVLSVQTRRIRLPVIFLLDPDGDTKDVVFPGRNDFYALSGYVARLPRGQRFLWVDRCGELSWLGAASDADDGGYCFTYGSLDSAQLPITHLNQQVYQFNPETLARASTYVAGKPVFYADRLPLLNTIKQYGTAHVVRPFGDGKSANDYAIVTGAGADRASFIEIKTQKTYLDKGITIIDPRADSGPPKLRHFPVCSAGGADVNQTAALDQAIEATTAEKQPLIIVKTSTEACKVDVDRDPRLAGAKLNGWRDLKPEDAYIGLLSESGQATEYVVSAGTSLAVQMTPPAAGRGARADRVSDATMFIP
ncbi:MAG: hypothetical protein EPN34_07550 [Burkholderiaceae bacterium]|nr:MAG: hypothetical protein EPN34_07550 [Burkholderiaceae bacterium]